METGLAEQVVLVTGASQGIGRAIALAFAAEGARLSVIARGAAGLEGLVEAIRVRRPDAVVHAHACDVTLPDAPAKAVAATLERFGRIDVLVNNVGGGVQAAFEVLDDAAWQRALDLNLFSAVRLCRAAVPHMASRGSGRVINLGALSASRPRRGQIASNTAKAALVNFTRSLALEAAPSGVLVNAVNPGSIESPRWKMKMDEKARASGRSLEDTVREVAARVIPLGRFGRPEEVAALVVFLASRQASYITGQSIDVDGAMGAGTVLE